MYLSLQNPATPLVVIYVQSPSLSEHTTIPCTAATQHLPTRSLAHLRLLVLIMVIHIRVPKHRLVPIAPEEVLRSDILVWILDTFLEGWKMAPVFPMFDPQVIGVDATEKDRGKDDAVFVS